MIKHIWETLGVLTKLQSYLDMKSNCFVQEFSMPQES